MITIPRFSTKPRSNLPLPAPWKRYRQGRSHQSHFPHSPRTHCGPGRLQGTAQEILPSKPVSEKEVDEFIERMQQELCHCRTSRPTRHRRRPGIHQTGCHPDQSRSEMKKPKYSKNLLCRSSLAKTIPKRMTSPIPDLATI